MTSEVPRINQSVRVAVPNFVGNSYNGEAEGAGRAEVYTSLPRSRPWSRYAQKKKEGNKRLEIDWS
jgi:hypothetical protein